MGRLSWICGVLQAGRPRLARIRGDVKYFLRRRAPQALTAQQQQEILWFRRTLERGRQQRLWAPFWPDGSAAPVAARVFSDASGTAGFGVIVASPSGSAPPTMYRGRWLRDDTAGDGPAQGQPSSSFRELVPLLLAVQLIAPQIPGQVLAITTDNLGNAFAINKGHCRSPESFELLYQIFEVAEQHGVFLIADWVPREFNHLLDLIPRARDVEELILLVHRAHGHRAASRANIIKGCGPSVCF